MSWLGEHGRFYEVPGFIDFLVGKGVIQDLSWKNDVCPAFGLQDPNSDKRVILWVDHPMKGRREHEQNERFAVQANDDIVLQTDDLEDALKQLFESIRTYRPGLPRAGPKEWRPGVTEPLKDKYEVEDFFNELKDEYYSYRR